MNTPQATAVSPEIARPRPRINEDWLAILVGGLLVLASISAVLLNGRQPQLPDTEKESLAWVNPLKTYLAVPGKWTSNPADSLKTATGILGAFLASAFVFASGIAISGGNPVRFLPTFCIVFLLGIVAYIMAEQSVIKNAGFEYAMWALLLGLLISNTSGTPEFMKPAIRTELYIKTGLVLLGCEVLLSQLAALGLPGICISWVVTPVVLISTFWFGQRVLRIESASLNMVISADMSVCGVSAAIATAAACRAKKEELSTAVGISLAFTVLMMFVMPWFIRLVGLDPVIAGAWIGGTIDSTGAVGVAGQMLGDTAGKVAVTVKMIQNMLIGAVAFGVAVYWVSKVERTDAVKPDITEIWRRFPKFILGFIGSSLVISLLHAQLQSGDDFYKAVVDGSAKTLRNWCFCLAFVSIGLETDFRNLAQFFRGGKAFTLYVCGQLLNLLLTLAMSWLMFRIIFPDAAKVLLEQ